MNTAAYTQFFSAFCIDENEKITVRFIKDKNKTGDPLKDASAGKIGRPADLAAYIEKTNAAEWGAFFMVNHSGTKGTLDADVQHARALFIDIDDGEFPAFFPVTPSCILSRSGGGGWHIYWFLSEVEKDLEKWKLAQKALIHFYKSDKTICNPARVMRVPGTVNHKAKYDSPPSYEITEMKGGRYTVDAVVAAHTDKEAIHKAAVKKARALFPKEKMNEGEGRHHVLIKASYVLNDYGITPDDSFNALKKIVKDKFVEPISDEKIHDYVTAQKSAKGESGAKSVEKALVEQAKIDKARSLLADWYYVRQQDAFFCEGLNVAMTSTGFNAKFAYHLDAANPARFAFMHDCIKQYESLVYDPAAETDIVVKGGIDRNMYEAPELEPIEKDPKWFTDHIAYLISGEIEREHFLNFLSFIVQNPGEKVMHGVLLIGRQGIGKSILQRAFSQIFGKSNVAAPHNENLAGTFTGWAKHCQLVVINELLQVDKKDFNNKIKPFITEPEIEIREMYKAPYTIKNCMNIIAFSNHDNALYIDRDDRRWFIVRSDAVQKDAAYYETLIENIDTKAGEVLHFLQTRDLSKFRPGATPPMTQAKQDIIEYSTSDLEAWIIDAIESGVAPFDCDLLTLQDIRDALPLSLRNGFATANRMGKIIRDHGGAQAPERIRVGNVLKRFWIVRDVEKYKNPAVMKAEIVKMYGRAESEENAGFTQ